MQAMSMGRMVFALTMLALGIMSLCSGDFAFVWQPVPAGIPGRALLAYASGAIMCAGGLGLLMRRTSLTASWVLTLYTLVWLLVLHVPHVVAAPLQEINWGAAGEIGTLVAASWILYASAVTPGDRPRFAWLSGPKAIRRAQILFAVSVPWVGLEHLIYGQATAAYVPAWLPGRLGWAYFTGAAHVAAGLAILVSVLPRLAAVLETWMMGLFTVLVWIPVVMAGPAQRFSWTALAMSTVITASAWIVAESYRSAPWLSLSRWRPQVADLATQ
ncbi:hypothetical protein [Dyella mobilis]|uniref:DoxX family protein n=1 Tax=Dyella mobilis TaxID=1849582 RepID=A0ABS2KFF7_9GAMM|nr:hypothetical protein [Dyella mobilis]MBM7129694.1 DoxX family protein [Dyella mobilis]GLQ98040.1 hypothetical protein GCM10007863_24600 [Dyella mobilis]